MYVIRAGKRSTGICYVFSQNSNVLTFTSLFEFGLVFRIHFKFFEIRFFFTKNSNFKHFYLFLVFKTSKTFALNSALIPYYSINIYYRHDRKF